MNEGTLALDFDTLHAKRGPSHWPELLTIIQASEPLSYRGVNSSACSLWWWSRIPFSQTTERLSLTRNMFPSNITISSSHKNRYRADNKQPNEDWNHTVFHWCQVPLCENRTYLASIDQTASTTLLASDQNHQGKAHYVHHEIALLGDIVIAKDSLMMKQIANYWYFRFSERRGQMSFLPILIIEYQKSTIDNSGNARVVWQAYCPTSTRWSVGDHTPRFIFSYCCYPNCFSRCQAFLCLSATFLGP